LLGYTTPKEHRSAPAHLLCWAQAFACEHREHPCVAVGLCERDTVTCPCISQGRSALMFGENDMASYEFRNKDLDEPPAILFRNSGRRLKCMLESSRSSPLLERNVSSTDSAPILLLELRFSRVISPARCTDLQLVTREVISQFSTRSFQGCGVDLKLCSNQVWLSHTVPHQSI
jgi:hypothetical protein